MLKNIYIFKNFTYLLFLYVTIMFPREIYQLKLLTPTVIV